MNERDKAIVAALSTELGKALDGIVQRELGNVEAGIRREVQKQLAEYGRHELRALLREKFEGLIVEVTLVEP